ncbi:MAG TPA: polysaccharide biosynthesis tyrosine autokinase [Longimicrobium sp.]|jgi:tyrosine-protein kinase Etk/Wzc|nr:polysaccharide biosynthesis tyrosine autokinase [Longimicrobium sp.]
MLNGSPPPSGENFRLPQVWHLLRRQVWVILGLTALSVGAAVAVTRMMRPEYASGATLRIDDDQRSTLSLVGVVDPRLQGGPSQLETEVDVLRSRRIAEAAVEGLSLHVQVLEPAAPRADLFVRVEAPRNAVAGVYRFTRNQAGRYVVSAEKGGARVALPAAVAPGEPFQLGGATLVLSPRAGSGRIPVIRLAVQPFAEAVADAQDALFVSRPNPRSQIVSIQYRSSDQRLAAELPNAVAQSFIAFSQRIRKTESGGTVEFLREQRDNYRMQLAAAEQGLRGFREQANVVNLEEEGTAQVRRMAELQAERDAALQERDALARLLTEVRSASASTTGASGYRQLAAFPAFLSNRTIQDLLQSLTSLENRRSDLLVMRTAENTEVRQLTSRIGEIEQQLFQIALNYQINLNNRLSTLDESLARFTGQSRAIPAREVEFVRLARQQKLLEDIYTMLETRLKEAEIQNAITAANVQVIDPALVPTRPVSPRPMLNYTLAALLGLALSIGLAFVREMLNTKVRSRQDAQTATGGLPVLGTVPSFGSIAVAANGNGNGRKKLVALPRLTVAQNRVMVLEEPRSPATEAYRAIRTSIMFASPEKAPGVLVVTSALPGDGKTTTSANLAAAFAQQETRVLLVDADLRRGVLHNVFNVPQTPGLTHVLLGMATMEDAVHRLDNPETGGRLHVLTTGVVPPNPAELVGSQRMHLFVEEARKQYDLIIFDAPPLNLVTDAALLGQIADATIIVARAGTTEKPALHHAAAQLRQVRASVGGIVLNGVEAGSGEGYGYGYYGNGA